jgi:hypothetical protein
VVVVGETILFWLIAEEDPTNSVSSMNTEVVQSIKFLDYKNMMVSRVKNKKGDIATSVDDFQISSY